MARWRIPRFLSGSTCCGWPAILRCPAPPPCARRPASAGIERYCLFIGAPRNGHSLVGALLDAHPQMVVAHELGVPRYVAARFSRRQVLYLLAANARRAAGPPAHPLFTRCRANGSHAATSG
jgi:hypothetical protein